jgi:hypothetical protein
LLTIIEIASRILSKIFRECPADRILYPYLASELRSRGYVLGSKNLGYIRFTSSHLSRHLPRTGTGWKNGELFLLELDFFWQGQFAQLRGVIGPGDEIDRSRIFHAVEGSNLCRKPDGNRRLVVYSRRKKFSAQDVCLEDEDEIERVIRQLVDYFADDIEALLSAIDKAIPEPSLRS